MIFTSHVKGGPYPDDVDLYSFLFHDFSPIRFDIRGTNIPLFIDEETGQEWTFEQVKERVDRLAVGLREKIGVTSDSVVLIYSANSIEYLVAILATHYLGGIVSCANPSFQPSELAYQLEESKAKAMFVGEDAAETAYATANKAGINMDKVIVMQTPKTCQARGALKGGPRKVDRGAWTLEGLVAEGKAAADKEGNVVFSKGRKELAKGEGKRKVAFLSFSSGTTGKPKGVAIQHSAPIANILQQFPFNKINNPPTAQDRFKQGQDRSLGVLPFFHIYGLIVTMLFTFYAGITNVVVPRFRGIEPMIQTAIKYKTTLWWLVPPQVVLLVKDPSAKPYFDRLQKLIRFIMIGAAPLSNDLSRQLNRLLPGLACEGYGMTESATVTLMSAPGHTVLGSAGRLFTDVEARVVKPDGKDGGVDESGELWVRSPSVTLGYFNNKAATEEMWVEDGWLRTGDEVRFNKEGDCFIVDRLKELIKVNGNQVAPAELEGLLLSHDDVGDVGVIGIPNDRTGELPLAFITLSSSAARRLASAKGSASEQATLTRDLKQSVMKFVAENKIRYKHLGRVEIIDAIPKLVSGKILRKELRERAKKLPPLEEEGEAKSKL